MMTTPTQDLCERLSHVEGMRRIGPLIAEARATIEAQAEHIQKQALEYITLFDQCSEALAKAESQAARIAELVKQVRTRGEHWRHERDRAKALEAKCALLAASLDQEEKRSAALEAGLTDGVTDDMAVLQSRVEELEAQLRERGEPVAWQARMVPEHLWTFTERPDDYRKLGWEVRPLYAHPPAATSITLRDDPQPDGSRVVRAMDGEEEVARMCLPAAVATFTCAARRQGSAGGNDPADCDWPTCGCDEHASKVIAALQESGHLKESAVAASEWRPIESAPKDGVIQLWVPPFGIWVDGPWRGAWSYAAQQWVLHCPFTAADGRSICVTDIPHPTHWMPLPTAPSIAAQKERGE